MSEKFVIYFDFPSTPEQIENVEKFSLNTEQSIEDAWIDLVHTFTREWKPDGDDESFIDVRFSSVYGFSVISPPYIQQKYPESIGKTTFKLPCLTFKADCVTVKVTGERIKIADDVLEELCCQLRAFIDTKDVSYAWCI
jgi:hypothetical protein